MVAAAFQRPPQTNGPGAGVSLRHSQPDRSDTLLPITQSRAASRRARTLRYLVYRIAARAVPNAQEPEEGRAAPAAHRQDFVGSEPPFGLERETVLELGECKRHQPPASI